MFVTVLEYSRKYELIKDSGDNSDSILEHSIGDSRQGVSMYKCSTTKYYSFSM